MRECVLVSFNATVRCGLQDEQSMEALAERMKALLGPFVLRRLKSEVASQLVRKQQRVRFAVLLVPLAIVSDARRPCVVYNAHIPAQLQLSYAAKQWCMS